MLPDAPQPELLLFFPVSGDGFIIPKGRLGPMTVLPLPREPIHVSTNCVGLSPCANADAKAEKSTAMQIIFFIAPYYLCARLMQGAKKRRPQKASFKILAVEFTLRIF